MTASAISYVFELPATVIWELCAVLDPGNMWEDVAAVMPNICDVDIDACRRLKTGERSTEALLRIWGSMGYKILDLYKVLHRLKYVRCMQILLPYVDKRWHRYAQNDAALAMREGARASALLRSAQPDTQRVTPDSSWAVYSKRASAETSSRRIPSGAGVSPAESQRTASSSGHNESSSAESDVLAGLQNTPAVRYEDILRATDNFADRNVLGRGGYGIVYRGVWQHLEVAVKRIQQQKESVRQSLQELRTLAKFRHDNVLSLYGYSMDGTEPCLVYQFMSNGSLEDRLLCRNATKPLSWRTKLAICRGVTCGLHFLHSIANNPIIHGDVKCANILLDRHMEPKLGDFGLSRDGQIELSNEEKSPMIASHVKGTLAYLPPEFTTSKIITTKLDVYSFGVVLLEVCAGQRAYSSSRNPPNLVDFLWKISADAKNDARQIWTEFADKRTPDPYADESRAIFDALLVQGTLCIQKDRFARPSFSEIFAVFADFKIG